MAPLSTLLFVALCGLTIALPEGLVTRNSGTIQVKPGQKIQTAIDNALAGSKIIVEKGVYDEQLVITKSGITLEGHEATIVPPKGGYVDNQCTPVTSNYTAPATIVSFRYFGVGFDVGLLEAEREEWDGGLQYVSFFL
jgi:hypothetical protein